MTSTGKKPSMERRRLLVKDEVVVCFITGACYSVYRTADQGLELGGGSRRTLRFELRRGVVLKTELGAVMTPRDSVGLACLLGGLETIPCRSGLALEVSDALRLVARLVLAQQLYHCLEQRVVVGVVFGEESRQCVALHDLLPKFVGGQRVHVAKADGHGR